VGVLSVFRVYNGGAADLVRRNVAIELSCWSVGDDPLLLFRILAGVYVVLSFSISDNRIRFRFELAKSVIAF